MCHVGLSSFLLDLSLINVLVVDAVVHVFRALMPILMFVFSALMYCPITLPTINLYLYATLFLALWIGEHTASQEKLQIDLSIQRHAVTSLSPNCGLIGWVPNCDTASSHSGLLGCYKGPLMFI